MNRYNIYNKDFWQAFIFFLFLSPSFILWSQVPFSGKVVDSLSGEALPFVNIIPLNDIQNGTVSDIDGKFELNLENPDEPVQFRYVGYYPKTVSGFNVVGQNTIQLKRSSYNLDEVVIFPTENPAHRIIKRAVANRKTNDPYHLNSFSYRSYDKFILTAVKFYDSEIIPDTFFNELDTVSTGLDSNNYSDTLSKSFADSLEEFFKDKHLFLMESVADHFYKAKGKEKVNVIGSRVSGLKNPGFFVLASQLQPFTFYEDHIHLLDKHYLNPITGGSTGKYLFVLEDTLYDQLDTVFVISYRPRKGKNFDGLKGVVYIHTHQYAIQNIIAEPFENENLVIRIKQDYRFLDDKAWFPHQLHTDLIINNVTINDSKAIGINRAYLTDIKLDNELPNKTFNRYELEMDKMAVKRTDTFWVENRNDTLSAKEKQTYHFIDSVGEEMNLDKKIKWAFALATGKLRTGIVDWVLKKILDFNSFEGIRLGAGLETNPYFSEWLKLRGYAGYGFRDGKFKYGGSIGFILDQKRDFGLEVSYLNDAFENGRGEYYLKDRKPIFAENIRRFLIARMYYKKQVKGSIRYRLRKDLQATAHISRFYTQVNGDYQLITHSEPNIETGQRDFTVTETGFQLRWAIGERLAKINDRVVSLGNPGPVFWLNYHKGINGWMNGQLAYDRIEAKAEYRFIIKNAGWMKIQLKGSVINGNVPFYMQYYGDGIDSKNSFYWVDGSFNTMPIYTYLSDRYISATLSHDFGKLLIKGKWFKPEIKITTSAIFGSLSNGQNHRNIAYKTLEKGYYESGLIINNVFNFNYINLFNFGLGIGVFYRYGPYQDSKTINNFAFKLAFHVGS